jgi:phosphocarrier protein HPr
MIKQQITLKNKFGLHTRAGAKLVDIAKRFESRIELIYRNRAIDAKSIMGVITLGAQKDSTLDLVINGQDEQMALVALVKLIDDKFGEE